MESTRFLSRRTLAAIVSLAATALVALSIVPGSGTANAAPSLAEAERTLKDLGAKLDAINEQYNKANATLKISRAKQAALEAQLKPFRVKADVYQKRINQIAATAYTGGRTTMINAVLAGQSPQEVIDQMGVLDQISRDQEGAIAAYNKAKKPYKATLDKLDAEIKVQAEQEKVLRDRKAALDKDMAKWTALAKQLRPRAASRSDRAPAPVYNGPATGNGAVVVKFAYAQIGKSYVFGASGPSTFDCSGLTMAAYAKIGKSLPHSSHLQYNQLTHVSRSALRPGDLVFFYSSRSHVGIYIGNNNVIHAPQPGERVKISSVDVFPFNGAGR